MMKKLRVILFITLGLSWGQWSQINNPGGQPISRMIYDGEQLIAATGFSELFSSSDDGMTWEALPVNANLVPYGVDLLYQVGDYLFVSQNIFSDNVNHRFHFSNNSWETLPYQNSTLMKLLSSGNQIFSIVQGGIALSNDFGFTWKLLNQPPIEGYINLLYIDDEYIYVNHGCSLYRTDDNGDEWENVTGVLDDIGPPEPYSCTTISDMETWNNQLIISVYWYGGVGTLFSSSNHGDTWNYIDNFPSQSASGFGNNNVSAILSDNNVLYLGTATSQDGLYYTHDLISWNDYSSGLASYDLAISNLISSDEYIYSVGNNTHQAALIESHFVSGDINVDGSIDVLDAINLVGFILGIDIPMNTEILAADLNSDGTLDIMDIVLLVEVILSTL